MVNPYQFIALDRASPSNTELKIAITCGAISDAATPCKIRPAINDPTLGAKPQAADASVNNVTANANTACGRTDHPICRR